MILDLLLQHKKAVGPKAAIKMNLPGVLDSYKSPQKNKLFL